jgi:ATP-dependent Zn protease
MTKLTPEKITAYHEAGHAVIARMLGIAVEYVTTLSDDLTDGGALTHSAAYLARDADQATRLAAITKDMVVSLAGPYAEMRYRPKAKRACGAWVYDREKANVLAFQAALIQTGVDIFLIGTVTVNLNADQEAYANELLGQCNERASDLVAEHWTKIDAVAKALLSRPILIGDDLDELIGTKVA